MLQVEWAKSSPLIGEVPARVHRCAAQYTADESYQRHSGWVCLLCWLLDEYLGRLGLWRSPGLSTREQPLDAEGLPRGLHVLSTNQIGGT